MDLQHHLFYLTFNSKLFFAPVENPRNALDVGTGTGIWAVDMGQGAVAVYALTEADPLSQPTHSPIAR